MIHTHVQHNQEGQSPQSCTVTAAESSATTSQPYLRLNQSFDSAARYTVRHPQQAGPPAGRGFQT